MATIASLIVKATAEGFEKVNRKLQEAAEKAKETEKQTSELGAAFKQLAVSAGAYLSVAGLISASNAGREIERMAYISNLSAEAFQAQAAAAATVGIESDKLADIYKDMQDRVGDFIQTGGGEMVDFFEQIAPRVGVTVEQFRKLNGRDGLQLFVDSLEKANLSQSEFVFYMEAMASDSTALLPLLRNNGEAFKALAEQATNYGLVLSQLEIDRLKQASADLATLGKLATVTGQRFVADLQPAISATKDAFLAIAQGISEFNKAVDQGDYTALLMVTGALGGAATAAGVAWLGYNGALIVTIGAAKAMTLAQHMLNVAMKANPLVRVITLLAALAGALYGARNETLTLGDTTASVGDYLMAVFGKIGEFVGWVWSGMVSGFDYAVDTISRAVTWLKDSFSGTFDIMFNVGKNFINGQIGLFVFLGRAIGMVTAEMVNLFQTAFGRILNIGRGFGDSLAAVFSGDFAFTAFKDALARDVAAPLIGLGSALNEALDQSMTTNYLGNMANGLKGVADAALGASRGIRETAAASYQARLEQQALKDKMQATSDTAAGTYTAGMTTATGATGLLTSATTLAKDAFVATSAAMIESRQQFADTLAAKYEEIRQNEERLTALYQQTKMDTLNSAATFMGSMGQMLEEHIGQSTAASKAFFKIQQAIQWASALMSAHATYAATMASYAQLAAVSGPAGPALLAVGKGMATANFALTAASATAIMATNLSKQRRFGGSVNAGDEVLVGESGPEVLRLGKQGGYVQPNHKLGGDAVSVTNVFQISLGVSDTIRAEFQAMAPQIMQLSQQAVLEAVRNGGQLSRAVGVRR
jgi:hypothetical protein